MRFGTRLALAFLGFALLGGRAAADMLSALLPAGVPGYGTAPGVTVASRLRPKTRPAGLRAGSFVLHPVLQEAFGFDSAPFGATGQGSWVLNTRPSLGIASDWSRDAFGAYVAIDNRRYLSAPTQDRTNVTLSLGGTRDIGRDRLTLSAAHLLQHQDRTQIGALDTDQPVAFRLTDMRASFAATDGAWTLTPDMRITAWRFGNATLLGAPLNQNYRDRTVIEGGATLDNQLAPRRDLLLVLRGLGQHYLHAQPGQPARDSAGFQALIGFANDDGGVWRYRLLVGVESRRFSAAAYSAHTEPIGEAAVTWNPSGVTTLTATLTRSMEDAAQEGVSGFTYTAAKLTVDHEWRRNLLLHVSAGVQRADFLQGGGYQTGVTMGAGITWLVNRRVHILASYGLSAQHGGSAGDYTRQSGLLTLRLGL